MNITEILYIIGALVLIALGGGMVLVFVGGMAIAAIGELRAWHKRQVERGVGLESPGEAQKSEDGEE